MELNAKRRKRKVRQHKVKVHVPAEKRGLFGIRKTVMETRTIEVDGKTYLNPAPEPKRIERTIPDEPNSRNTGNVKAERLHATLMPARALILSPRTDLYSTHGYRISFADAFFFTVGIGRNPGVGGRAAAGTQKRNQKA
ncbi:MAG: hypothetical protein SOR89_04695 [Ndongobacter sp.]|nr:hypothetical protein [Ndongobacter sp.]